VSAHPAKVRLLDIVVRTWTVLLGQTQAAISPNSSSSMASNESASMPPSAISANG
jgi:hypothetical protein